MKRTIFLLLSCLLFCSAAYAEKRDSGPGFEKCLVFDLAQLDNLVAHVKPNMPELDDGLQFGPIHAAAAGNTFAHADYERQHSHNIDPGSITAADVDNKRSVSLRWRHTSVT